MARLERLANDGDNQEALALERLRQIGDRVMAVAAESMFIRRHKGAEEAAQSPQERDQGLASTAGAPLPGILFAWPPRKGGRPV